MTATPYGLRDRIAIAACNWVLDHVATEQCRTMIGGAIRYGMAAADRDEREVRRVAMRPASEDEDVW
jgi:hypothetical protein